MLPERFTERMRGLLGDEFESFLHALTCEKAKKGFRINRLKTDPDEFSRASELPAKALPYVRDGFILIDEVSGIGNTPMHAAGQIYIQDPGAMASAAALDITPGMRVCDLCAAPGGKSTQIASALANDGTLAYAVLGIGVNLFAPVGGFPPNISATAIFPSERQGEYLALRDALIRAILPRFAAIYDKMPDRGFLMDYRRLSLLTDREVLVYDALTDREKNGIGTPARVIGINDDGALTVRFADGREVALSSGEVTLKV